VGTLLGVGTGLRPAEQSLVHQFMKWIPKAADVNQIEVLAGELLPNVALGLKTPQLATTLARLLVMRGIADSETAERFLAPSLAHLYSPYL